MTLDEMYAEMDLYGFDDFEDAQKLTLLNESYFDLITREPWPFLETTTDLLLPSGEAQITNNSAVLNPSTNVSMPLADVNTVLSFIDLTNRVVMVPERTDVIEKNYMVIPTNIYPDKYYFIAEDMFVYPAAMGDTTYRLYYLRTPVAATATTDTGAWILPERHHSVVLYGALVKAFLVNDDPQAAMFQNMYESRYQQMRADAWMQQYDRTDRIHVITDAYDWNY